ncbi:hypothetical protein DPMN_085269 [Dreissena polymorpha]|uniref:Uncharacterized protein n=1 Tax=Dreissena polymorpha TaxID=45954 RepID=A0A9D3YGK4_DREPO|nr:hypothetical protein DPMN_085269 [Dreissena polymorpha]
MHRTPERQHRHSRSSLFKRLESAVNAPPQELTGMRTRDCQGQRSSEGCHLPRETHFRAFLTPGKRGHNPHDSDPYIREGIQVKDKVCNGADAGYLAVPAIIYKLFFWYSRLGEPADDNLLPNRQWRDHGDAEALYFRRAHHAVTDCNRYGGALQENQESERLPRKQRTCPKVFPGRCSNDRYF